jgi:pyruvate kinase
VLRGGRLADRARIFLPPMTQNDSGDGGGRATPKDVADAQWSVDVGADFVIASGVRGADDLASLRRRLTAQIEENQQVRVPGRGSAGRGVKGVFGPT